MSRIEVIDLRDDDLAVLMLEKDISLYEATDIRDRFISDSGHGKTMVMGNGVKLAILRNNKGGM